jgi:hypothetical protein
MSVLFFVFLHSLFSEIFSGPFISKEHLFCGRRNNLIMYLGKNLIIYVSFLKSQFKCKPEKTWKNTLRIKLLNVLLYIIN